MYDCPWTGERREFTSDQRDEVCGGLAWLGIRESRLDEVDVCSDGSVYLGLTMVLPKRSIELEACHG